MTNTYIFGEPVDGECGDCGTAVFGSRGYHIRNKRVKIHIPTFSFVDTQHRNIGRESSGLVMRSDVNGSSSGCVGWRWCFFRLFTLTQKHRKRKKLRGDTTREMTGVAKSDHFLSLAIASHDIRQTNAFHSIALGCKASNTNMIWRLRRIWRLLRHRLLHQNIRGL